MKRNALLVGVATCPEAKLYGPDNDCPEIERVLEKCYQFTTKRVQNVDATRDRILAEMDALCADTGPDDHVVFYFSGHGTRLRGDGDEPEVEAICPHDFGKKRKDRAIRDHELQARLRPALEQGARVTAIFDCCFSGGLSLWDLLTRMRRELGLFGSHTMSSVQRPIHEHSQVRYFPDGLNPLEMCIGAAQARILATSGAHRPFALPSDADHDGRFVVFCACTAFENAIEFDYDPVMGVFTRHLVNVLRGAEQPLTNVAVRDRVRASALADGKRNQKAVVSPEDGIFLA